MKLRTEQTILNSVRLTSERALKKLWHEHKFLPGPKAPTGVSVLTVSLTAADRKSTPPDSKQNEPV